MDKIIIDKDIRKAHTPPATFYTEDAYFEQSKERIFETSWQYACDASEIDAPMTQFPFSYMPNFIEEPLLISSDKQGQEKCLSNVCTHRGKILVEGKTQNRQISCGYHGRCFRLDGSFKSMPCFDDVEDFPTEKDHLKNFPLERFANLLFTSMNPKISFEAVFQPILDRLSWLPLDQLEYVESSSKDYTVQAHWALYCDNYLEGFHIPFVHPALNNAIEFDKYFYETYAYCNLQVGIAKEREPYFELPPDSPDYGKKVYAYYYFVFPNMMLNFYPWGLSLNIVRPISKEQTIIEFRSYKFPEAHFNPEVNALDETELEDEAVVESVQQGLKGKTYHRGRYSPSMEQNVHHFHTLLFDKLYEQD